MAVNSEEYINKMYDSSLESQKQTLQSDYEQNAANLDTEQEKARKQTDANLNRTYVEAAKAAKNYGEVQNAYGLTSGAMAQARLAQDNQLQADLTTIRAAQQTVDADVERQRTLLSKEYAAAIQQAQADNDLQRAQALYEAAKEDEQALLQQQKEAGKLMAGVGDYSILGRLYGLTDSQIARLQGGGKSSSSPARSPYTDPDDGDLDDGDPDDGDPDDTKTSKGMGRDEQKKNLSTLAISRGPIIGAEPATIAEEYRTLVQNGASTRETDTYLKSAVAAGYLSPTEASAIRNG